MVHIPKPEPQRPHYQCVPAVNPSHVRRRHRIPGCAATSRGAIATFARSVESAAVDPDNGEYVNITHLVRHLVGRLAAGRTEEFPAVFAVVERVLADGDEASESPTVGAVLRGPAQRRRVHRHHLPAVSFRPLAGSAGTACSLRRLSPRDRPLTDLIRPHSQAHPDEPSESRSVVDRQHACAR